MIYHVLYDDTMRELWPKFLLADYSAWRDELAPADPLTPREVWQERGAALVSQASDLMARHILATRDPLRACKVAHTMRCQARGYEHLRGHVTAEFLRGAQHVRTEFVRAWERDLTAVRVAAREGARRAAVAMMDKHEGTPAHKLAA